MSDASQNDDTARIHGDQEELVTYPEHQVLAVLDGEDQTTAAIEALVDGGFADTAVQVSCGTRGADALRASTGRSGLAGLAIRVADRLGIENREMEFKSHYEQALRDGRYVVAVEAPTEERKSRAVDVLRHHGAHAISYYDRFTIEVIEPPAVS